MQEVAKNFSKLHLANRYQIREKGIPSIAALPRAVHGPFARAGGHTSNIVDVRKRASGLRLIFLSTEKGVKAIDKPAAAQDWQAFMEQHKVLLGMLGMPSGCNWPCTRAW